MHWRYYSLVLSRDMIWRCFCFWWQYARKYEAPTTHHARITNKALVPGLIYLFSKQLVLLDIVGWEIKKGGIGGFWSCLLSVGPVSISDHLIVCVSEISGPEIGGKIYCIDVNFHMGSAAVPWICLSNFKAISEFYTNRAGLSNSAD